MAKSGGALSRCPLDLAQGMTRRVAYSRLMLRTPLHELRSLAREAELVLARPSLSAEIVLYFAWDCLGARICP